MGLPTSACWSRTIFVFLTSSDSTLSFVGKLRRRPESEPFFLLAKTAKQAMFVLSSMQPDAARRKKGRSKPDRVFRHSLRVRVRALYLYAGELTCRFRDSNVVAQADRPDPHDRGRVTYHQNVLMRSQASFLLGKKLSQSCGRVSAQRTETVSRSTPT